MKSFDGSDKRIHDCSYRLEEAPNNKIFVSRIGRTAVYNVAIGNAGPTTATPRRVDVTGVISKKNQHLYSGFLHFSVA